MRRLVLFLALSLALLASVAAFNWWVDPLGEVWKPGALAAARADGCLISEELIGSRYYAFKLAVFHDRPTRTFVVGSSRVLKIQSHRGERTFANLGYPGTAPETILQLFRALPARPVQTVYLGVEAFWFNKRYRVPDTNPSDYRVLEYLLSRSALWDSLKLAHQLPEVRPPERWQRDVIGDRCTIGRASPTINWQLDGSRVWSWELDPEQYPPFTTAPFTSLASWRNGYFAHWRSLDLARVHVLEQVLALARARGWRVVGFAPPEPPAGLRVLDTNPNVAPEWYAFLRLMPQIFAADRYPWIGLGVRCPGSAFPDGFHSDAACSARLRDRLDEVARRVH